MDVRPALVLIVVACNEAQAPTVAAGGSAARPADPYANLDLSFEDLTAHWHSATAATYAWEAVTDKVHGGKAALRMRAKTATADFGTVISSFDATRVQGKHLRLHG